MANIFADLNKTFDLHPLNDDIQLVTDEDAVRESIKNLIFTGPYDRYRKPELGAGIPQDLFENITPQTEYEVKQRIRSTINNYEPRAKLIDVLVTVAPDQNSYTVTIVFTTKNSFEPITVEQILTRRR